MELATYHEYAEEIEHRLKLKTFALAIRLLRTGEDVPEGMTRPKRDMGCHMSLCQAFEMSRRDGTPMAMLREDMWCPEPVIGFGLQEAPAFFMEGNNRYPRDVSSPDAGRIYAEELPKLPTGMYTGVLSAPLHSTPFEPDVITIYCIPAQLSQLLLGYEYKDGHNLNCDLSSHAACIYGVVPVLTNGHSQVAIPCRGDRYSAMAEDEEMLFSLTPQELGEMIVALRHLESTGSVYPKGYRMHLEYPQAKAYKEIADMMGYLE
ncbi:DUF169 domain-containing protein [Candidatus Bipolaricaulota bacterium]|nr:DUF169 domain-containing protein [Candidatus Bipolaricaulota bacterium]